MDVGDRDGRNGDGVMANVPTLRIARGTKLPDKGVWTNRFEIRSQSTNHVYVVSQHRDHRHWGCSCPGWRIHRNCKHLSAIRLPAYERAHEVTVSER